MRKLLARLLRRSVREPLAELRQPVPDEDYWRLRREQHEADMLDALRDGEHFLSYHTNVAAGRGRTVHDLCDQGLMDLTRVTPRGAHYAPTLKGVAYLRERS